MVLSAIAPYEATINARQQSIADWMEANIRFSPERPRPGPLVLDDWQRPILDSVQNSRETVLKIYSQGGKSMMFCGAMGWVIETGKSAMFAWPTGVLREAFMSSKLEPMLEDCPRLDSLIVRTDKGELGTDELERVNGSPIPLRKSGSQGGLQQVDTEYTFADEIDKFKRLSESNDPMQILKGRGRAYGEDRAHLIVASTPTTTDTSLVEVHYNLSCRFRRHAVCPLCEDLTLLVFDPEKPDRLNCQCCHEMLPFDAQPEMLASGRWIADRPQLIGLRDGYHLNQFWDARTPWQSVLADYNPEKPRDFLVQQMAIPASSLGEEPLAEEELEGIFQPVPPGWPQVAKVLMVDVQRRRDGEIVYALWTVHNSTKAPVLVCRWQRVITRGRREWASAFRELRREWRAAKPSVMFVDAGDGHGCDVMELLRQVFRSELRRGTVRPVKGWAPQDSRLWGGQPYIKSQETIKTKKKKLNEPLQICSPSCKSRFIELVRQERVILSGQPGVDYPTNIIQQFAAEELRSYIGVGGMERLKWVKLPGRENEALDLGTYALASTAYLGSGFAEKREYGPVMGFVPGAAEANSG